MDDERVRWEKFLKTHDGVQVAAQLRYDQELCKARRLPSLLALYMPSPSSDLADSVSLNFLPESPSFPRSVRQMQYSGIINGIKAHLHQMTPDSPQLGPNLQSSEHQLVTEPTMEQFETALTVLRYLVMDPSVPEIQPECPINVLSDTLNAKLRTDPVVHPKESTFENGGHDRTRLNCYMCQMRLVECHPGYASLCKACGRFNLAESKLSLPENLNLKGKTALVTGGRLNLGYHISLRLLRCGANVVVSTRYPRDAESRYTAETDSSEWCHRIRIVGADFRAAKDVFQLVAVVKDQLARWKVEANEEGEPKLDILINNAAQTLTDPVETERKAIAFEKQLQLTGTKSILINNSFSYQARVRGGMDPVSLLNDLPAQSARPLNSITHSNDPSQQDGLLKSSPASHEISLVSQPTPKSSWMQSLHEIPYEDVVSAHSVNTLVPLILIRELLTMMGSTRSHSLASTSAPKKVLSHIVNVSSREGTFETSPSSSSKWGHHVHTNMSKAGLNMITETEAERCWMERRVAMNTVDPGYMSAAPEIAASWGKGPRSDCPIGWEDGAGRVLWPIAVSWGKDSREEAVWGRFLKHFGAVEVNVGVGR